MWRLGRLVPVDAPTADAEDEAWIPVYRRWRHVADKARSREGRLTLWHRASAGLHGWMGLCARHPESLGDGGAPSSGLRPTPAAPPPQGISTVLMQRCRISALVRGKLLVAQCPQVSRQTVVATVAGRPPPPPAPRLREQSLDHLAAMGDQHVHVWENTYIMHPKDEEKFLPSKVQAAIKKVMEDYLKDKEYHVDEAKMWTLDLSNDIKAAVKADCNIPRYKVIVQAPTALGSTWGEVLGTSAGAARRIVRLMADQEGRTNGPEVRRKAPPQE